MNIKMTIECDKCYHMEIIELVTPDYTNYDVSIVNSINLKSNQLKSRSYYDAVKVECDCGNEIVIF